MDCAAQLQDQVRAAASKREPLRIRGGGSKAFLGNAVAGTGLDLRPHRGIVRHDPGELVITARAGTPLSEIEAALDTAGQMLPSEPPRFAGSSTFGGMVAAGLSGPRRPWAGAVRDFVLGCRVIDGHGQHLRFGGEVMKNVAGYDVSRLMTGSFGCLGALTEISMKVLPKPQERRSLRLELPLDRALVQLREWAREPMPVSAACHDGSALRLRLEGGAASVAATAARLGGESIDDAYWTALRDHTLPFFASGAPLWRISVPKACPVLPIPGATLHDWAGAQRWVRSDMEAARLRGIVSEAGGHATFYGPGASEPFHPLAPAMSALHRRLKAQLDPHGLFNRGRMYADL